MLFHTKQPFVIRYSACVSLRNKGGNCIPNSTTEVWTVDDVDLLNFVKVQRDQHVLSSDTLHQDLIGCGRGLVFILSNQQCGKLDVESTRKINQWISKCIKCIFMWIKCLNI